MFPVVTGSPWPGVCYFSTARAGGVSQGDYASLNLGMHVGDDPAHVDANRHLLRQRVPADPYWLQQVHGVHVVDADVGQAVEPRADAAVTRQRGRVLVVLTADCLPVVLADTQGRVAGIAHAGWRGLAQGVLERTLARLRGYEPKAQWRVWMGPAIGADAFEVGCDVFNAFVATHPDAAAHFRPGAKAGKWFADLPALATLRLRAAGVDEVQWCGHCTFSRPQQYFSWRRQATTGRMATCVFLVGT